MKSSRLERFAPLSGVAATVFTAAAFIIGGSSPEATDSTQKVVQFYTDNDAQQMIAGALLGLGAAALVWFGASLRVALRDAEGAPGRLSSIAQAGTIVMAVGFTIFGGLAFSAGDSVGDVPGEVTQTINVLGSDMFITVAAGVVVLQFATAISVLRHGGLPRWLGWVSLVIGIAGIGPGGFFAFLATGIWFAVVGIVLFTRPEPPPTGAAGAIGRIKEGIAGS